MGYSPSGQVTTRFIPTKVKDLPEGGMAFRQPLQNRMIGYALLANAAGAIAILMKVWSDRLEPLKSKILCTQVMVPAACVLLMAGLYLASRWRVVRFGKDSITVENGWLIHRRRHKYERKDCEGLALTFHTAKVTSGMAGVETVMGLLFAGLFGRWTIAWQDTRVYCLRLVSSASPSKDIHFFETTDQRQLKKVLETLSANHGLTLVHENRSGMVWNACHSSQPVAEARSHLTHRQQGKQLLH